ncbi:MAG TPA: adenylate kinase [Candidatus Dormibacteraeota bacterium]|nr:adenylate kinase [Candidatus Dormibacteraeota bacterium]
MGGSGARLVLLGAPGVGKGTQAAEISRRTGLPHISTGDLLRAAIRDGSPLGRRVAAIVERGELVPDGLVAEVMEERLARPDAADGFLLDGFPRTVAQADLLDSILAKRGQALDRVIGIEVPEAEIVDRLAGRRSCGNCGATYHVRYNRPKVDGVCDRCGSELRQRPDDVEAAIAQRLKAYREQTAPLVARYRKTGRLVEIDGRGTPDEVFGRIAAVVTGLTA